MRSTTAALRQPRLTPSCLTLIHFVQRSLDHSVQKREIIIQRFVVVKSSVSAGVWSLTQVMPREQSREPGARLGPLVSWRSETGSRAWSCSRESFLVFMSSGRKQTITCISVSRITSGLISRADHSRGLKITDRERQRLFANIVNTRRCNACPSVCFGEFYLDWSLYFIFLSLPFFSRFCWICIFLLRDNLQNVCENVSRLYKIKCKHSFSTYF